MFHVHIIISAVDGDETKMMMLFTIYSSPSSHHARPNRGEDRNLGPWAPVAPVALKHRQVRRISQTLWPHKVVDTKLADRGNPIMVGAIALVAEDTKPVGH